MVILRSNEPSPEIRARHLKFIMANWAQFAIASFKGYRGKGRGMLALYDEDFLGKPLGVFTKYRMVYVAEGSEAFKLAGGEWSGEKERKWVKSYNPSTTVLFTVFRASDEGVSSYRIQGVGNRIPEQLFNREKGTGK